MNQQYSNKSNNNKKIKTDSKNIHTSNALLFRDLMCLQFKMILHSIQSYAISTYIKI